MRFKKQISGTRTRTFFAYLPVTIETDNVTETRWLETVTVYEEYVEGVYHSYWTRIKFIDKYDDIVKKP